MNVTLAGPAEGHLKDLFNEAKEQEANWIICAGDFGIFPDPARRDRASKKHVVSEFADRYSGVINEEIRIPVLTISGVHEDHQFLAHRKSVDNTEILSNVHWLANGYRTVVGLHGPPMRVTGLGRAYSEATYHGNYSKRSKRHYTRHDIERACSSGPTDLLVVYENLDAEGIRNMVFATRPQLILTVDHPNRPIYPEVQGIPVVTLGRRATRAIKWEKGKIIC
jgi:hypothetical protein